MFTSEQKRSVAHYLFCQGHARPTFDGEKVKFLDRTPGFPVMVRTSEVQPFFDEIRGLSITMIQGKVDNDRGVYTEAARIYRAKKGIIDINYDD